jgi:hypothetical protein
MHWKLRWLSLHLFHSILIPILMCVWIGIPCWVQIGSTEILAIFHIITVVVVRVMIMIWVVIVNALIAIHLIWRRCTIAVLLVIYILRLIRKYLLLSWLIVLKVWFRTVSRHITTISTLGISQILALLTSSILLMEIHNAICTWNAALIVYLLLTLLLMLRLGEILLIAWVGVWFLS